MRWRFQKLGLPYYRGILEKWENREAIIKMKGIPWKGGYIDGRGWRVMEEELWTAIVHWLWIETGGSCNMVGSSEVNGIWIENTLNSELWTLNPEPWTLNPERGSCNKVGSLKRISVLLTPLSNVGVVDLEVCCPILGSFHSAPRYFNFIDRSEVSVGRVPHLMMLEMLEIFWNGYQLLLPWTLNPELWTLRLYNSFRR